jgi:hypothetical protein
MVAGSDVIFLDTSRGWLARQDYSLEDAHGKSPPTPRSLRIGDRY